MSNTLNDREQFINLISKVKRDGIDKLMQWLEGSDFYTAPASTRHHGAHQGGLLRHSLNVYDEMLRLLKIYPQSNISEETIIIVSLFHDLCKVNFYGVEKRNRKSDQGKWESYDAYVVNEKYKFGGHGGKSVYLAQKFINITPLEAAAINCHMASWDGNTTVGEVFKQNKVAWLLHVADEAATFLVES